MRSRLLATGPFNICNTQQRKSVPQEERANMSTASDKGRKPSANSNVDPRTRVRTVPMEVLSLGYSRTATMSMYILSLSGNRRSKTNDTMPCDSHLDDHTH